MDIMMIKNVVRIRGHDKVNPPPAAKILATAMQI